jgi:predicted Ser/Thr protein kinase
LTNNRLSADLRHENEARTGSLADKNDKRTKFSGLLNTAMLKVKDTLRATVHLSFDGRVFKNYHGPDAQKRFENEVRVLRHLDARGCNFVPRLLEADAEKLRIITTNCGSLVEHLDEKRAKELFAELEKFGVRHDDPDKRNVTYRQSDGRFCLIDFEFATILPESKPT